MLQVLWSVDVLISGGLVAVGDLVFHPGRAFGDYYLERRMFGGDRE